MKKILTIGITIIVILVAVIGGKVYMDNKKEKEQVRQAEKELALYIVQNYEGVKKIEFNDSYVVKETGSWGVAAIINGNSILKISIEDDESLKSPTIAYNPAKFFMKKRKKDTKANLTNVELLYSEDNND